MQREETTHAAMNNPTTPSPPRPPIPIPDGHRSAKNIQIILAVSYASLVFHCQESTAAHIQARSLIKAPHLHRRVQFFLRQFRISIHRRILCSRKSRHLRKLCQKFLQNHPPASPVSYKLLKRASNALEAAIQFPIIDDAWHEARSFLCRTTAKLDPAIPWPLPSAHPHKASDVSILFWNCNGQHAKEHKRTLLMETSKELRADVVALVETKSTNTFPPVIGFNTISFRPAIPHPTSQNERHASGGICVGKRPSEELTGSNTKTFTGYIEATATSLTSSWLSITLVTCYIPPYQHATATRGDFTDEAFFDQLNSLYHLPLLFIADANADIRSWTGRGVPTIRRMIREGWDLISSPDHITTVRGSCIDIVLTRNFPHACSVNIIPLSDNDHQGVHVIIHSPPGNRGLPNTCNRKAAIDFAKSLWDIEGTNPHHRIAAEALSEAHSTTPPTMPTQERMQPSPSFSRPQPNRPAPQAENSLLSSIIEHLAHPDIPLHPAASTNPIPRDSISVFDEIIRAVNIFSKTVRQMSPESSDPLYTELKTQLHQHSQLIHLKQNARSHRVLGNLYQRILRTKSRVTKTVAKIRIRRASQDAVETLTFASQNANCNAIVRRVEKAFNPNKTILNIATLSADDKIRHTNFWTERWGRPYLLPPDRHAAVQLYLNPPPGTSPPHSFSITHHPDGSPWLPDFDEVDHAIKCLENHRAPGPSGIPVDLFKLTPQFTEDLVTIFESIILNQSSTPVFSNCRLILLHKAGLITEPKNYRPINLTESGFRILETLLKNRLQTWGESVLHQDQYGFRSGQSTMSALFRIITSLHAAIAQRRPLLLCFLDAVKAFDRVPHDAILEALIANGLCPSSCKLLHSIISNHVSLIMSTNDVSLIIQIAIECGVLQGGILSPFFFNIFANSILTDPNFKSMQALYADDRTLMDDNAPSMQASLSLLEEWASTRNLLHDGNEVIVINTPPPNLKIHDKPIPQVPSAKCLGLTIWDTGKIERANIIPQTTFRALKVSSIWHRARLQVPFSTLKALVTRYMLPTSLYGSALFTDNIGPAIDKFIYQIMRKATLSHNSTNSTLLLEFSGIIRPSIRIHQEVISVLSRMLDNSSSHVRDALFTQFNLGLPFAMKIRKLLDSLANFPICGPSLSNRLDAILAQLDQPPPPPTCTLTLHT